MNRFPFSILVAVFFIAVVIRPSWAFSQSDTGYAISISPAVVFNRVVDESFSTIPFTGNTWGFEAAASKQKRKSFNGLRIYYNTGDLKPAKAGEGKMNYYSIGGDFMHLHTVFKSKMPGWVFKAGGSIEVEYARREYKAFINNNSTFDFCASLAAVIEPGYTFKAGLKGLTVTDQFIVPLVSSVSQPAFGSSETTAAVGHDRSEFSSFIKSNTLKTFGGYDRFINRFMLTQHIRANHFIGACYKWDFYEFRTNRAVRSMQNEILLTYQYRF